MITAEALASFAKFLAQSDHCQAHFHFVSGSAGCSSTLVSNASKSSLRQIAMLDHLMIVFCLEEP